MEQSRSFSQKFLLCKQLPHFRLRQLWLLITHRQSWMARYKAQHWEHAEESPESARQPQSTKYRRKKVDTQVIGSHKGLKGVIEKDAYWEKPPIVVCLPLTHRSPVCAGCKRSCCATHGCFEVFAGCGTIDSNNGLPSQIWAVLNGAKAQTRFELSNQIWPDVSVCL